MTSGVRRHPCRKFVYINLTTYTKEYRIQDTEYRMQNTKTIYGPLINTALYVMLLRWANPLLGQVGGLGLDIWTFLDPKLHSPNGSMPFHRAQIDFQGPTPSHLLS
jgi:hypothetical protein